MKLVQARVQNYRSVRDTGWFEVEDAKTILVGPNEAGKTAVLEALQQINPPPGAKGFDALRDYPRKLYNADIQSGRLAPRGIPVASARFALEPDDLVSLPDEFADATYSCTRHLDNRTTHQIEGGPETVVYGDDVRKDLQRLAIHVDARAAEIRGAGEPPPSAGLESATGDWRLGATRIADDRATALRQWLDEVVDLVDENNEAEEARHTRLLGYTSIAEQRSAAFSTLYSRLPVFVYYSNYFGSGPISTCAGSQTASNRTFSTTTAMTMGTSAFSSCWASKRANLQTSATPLIPGTTRKHSSATAANSTNAASSLTPPASASPTKSARFGTPARIVLRPTPS